MNANTDIRLQHGNAISATQFFKPQGKRVWENGEAPRGNNVRNTEYENMNATEFTKLVDDFGHAALKAGASNSGYAIDIGASVHWDRMQEFRKKLLALAPVVATRKSNSVL